MELPAIASWPDEVLCSRIAWVAAGHRTKWYLSEQVLTFFWQLPIGDDRAGSIWWEGEPWS